MQQLAGDGTRTWIHQTDLFRPAMDPDDHWDLACVFQMAAAGFADLGLVLIDHPAGQVDDRNPDITAVSQLNRIHALAIPVLVGTSQWTSADILPESYIETAAARAVISTLRQSVKPVIAHIVGSTRDIALALTLDPEAFARNCAGIYLNAGLGCRSTLESGLSHEYNVVLSPDAYSKIFAAPCPVYWAPCFDDKYEAVVHEYGTWWDFEQGEALVKLSESYQRYFASALAGVSDTRWLTYLETAEVAEIIAQQSPCRRNMWSTAGFLHAAGLAVGADGTLMRTEDCRDPVFEFVPIDVRCSQDGHTEWSHKVSAEAPEIAPRYIFRVNNLESYRRAMTGALISLLTDGLP